MEENEAELAESRQAIVAIASGFRWLHLSEIPRAVMEEGIRSHQRGRPWEGPVVRVSDQTVMFVGVTARAVTRRLPERCTVLPYSWASDFGATTTFTFLSSTGTLGRVFVRSDTPELEAILARRQINVVFVRGDNPLWAAMITFAEGVALDHLRMHVNLGRAHQGVVDDHSAAVWDTIGCLESYEYPLSAQDRLALGWMRRCRRHLSMLKEKFTSEWPLGSTPSSGHPALEILASSRGNTSVFVKRLAEVALVSDESYLGFQKGLAEVDEEFHRVTDEDHICPDVIVSAGLELAVSHSSRTISGSRIPWLSVYGKLEYHSIDAKGLPPGYNPESFWPSFYNLPAFQWGAYVNPGDAPANLQLGSVDWNSMPLAESAEESNSAAEQLLSDASVNKKWTIPPGAAVQLNYGPFRLLQLWETDNPPQVFCLLRKDDSTLSFASLELDNGVLYFPDLDWLPPFLSPEHPEMAEWAEKRPRVQAALKLVLSAIIRDFFVLEHRDAAFRAKAISVGRGPRTSGSPRVIYLPRIRYSQKPDVGRCASELAHTERAAHRVMAHLRRSESASNSQLLLAARYGIRVPQGYTFVRPHDRGGQAAQVVYRSRSALRSMFVVDDSGPASERHENEWFKFESDVRVVLTRLGFAVQHVSAPGRGDRGVDLFATKGDDLDQVNWIIQCKCYATKNRIGPSLIRELIGSLQEHPRGTRGMLVTTSSFTTDARVLAQTQQIRLIDGDEFAQLLHQ